jgi:hypothetical protein
LPEHFLNIVSENYPSESQWTFCFFSRETTLKEFESCSGHDQQSMRIRMNCPEEGSQARESLKSQRMVTMKFGVAINYPNISGASTSGSIQAF